MISMKRKYWIILVILIVISIVVITLLPKSLSVDNLRKEESGQLVILKGIVKTGAQIGTDYHINYCSEPFYLEDDTGYIQLNIKDEKYLGKEVEVIGRYVVPVCEALCICERNIMVYSIRILEKN